MVLAVSFIQNACDYVKYFLGVDTRHGVACSSNVWALISPI